MNYFGFELRFGLLKNTNQDLSLINLRIPDIILKFLYEHQSDLNINIEKLTQFESQEIRYFYNEEVKELREFANAVLVTLENNYDSPIFQEYCRRHHLTETDFSQEDLSEVFNHLIYLCNVVLNGQKILYVSSSYDDSAMVEG